MFVHTQGVAQKCGEIALFLHGNPDSGLMWQAIVDAVQDRYFCIVPDLPGFHRSADAIAADFDFTFDDYADCVAELLDQHSVLEPVTLVMHDWGGIIGMAFAAKYPHRVKRVIGGDFPFHSSYRWHAWAQVWRTPLLGELSVLLMNWPLFKWEIQRGSPKMPLDVMRQTYRHIGGWTSKKAMLKYYRSADPAAFAQWESACQTLSKQVSVDLIWGEDDVYVDPAEAQAIPHSTLTLVPGCGHWVPWEAPEVYVQALLD